MHASLNLLLKKCFIGYNGYDDNYNNMYTANDNVNCGYVIDNNHKNSIRLSVIIIEATMFLSWQSFNLNIIYKLQPVEFNIHSIITIA